MCLARLEDDPLELGNAYLNIKVGVLATQIGLQPLQGRQH